jgi:hypothetical protein
MSADLFMTGDGLPVCEAHLEKYIDDPSFRATQCDYDAWFHSHGVTMSCRRCKGAIIERGRNQMDVAILEADSAEGRRGTASGRALDDEIVRHFAEYITHASYAE